MSYGFSGKAARGYLEEVSACLSEAVSAHNVDPFDRYGVGAVACPTLPQVYNKTLPYDPSDAVAGGYSTGVGNQSNIAVSHDIYVEVSQRASYADKQMAQALDASLRQIKEMCDTVYIMPKTRPRYLNILDSLHSSLGEFCALADDADILSRRFSGEISNI